MATSDFKYFLEKLIERNHLYVSTINCANCRYRSPWNNFCRKFLTSIEKVNQRNGGFHHKPCEQCINYKITQQDIDYLIYRYCKKLNKPFFKFIIKEKTHEN